MGQDHHPVCIEAEQGLSPHALGYGLKEGQFIPAALNAWFARRLPPFVPPQPGGGARPIAAARRV